MTVAWDSNGFYRMVYIENLDSLAVADSLAMADSLAVIDSLAVRADSLAVIDSLAGSGNILTVKGDTTVVDKEERVRGKSWLKRKE